MPDSSRLVVNTGPLLALIAAFGDLNVLASLYSQVLVPLEVCHEIEFVGATGFGVKEFQADKGLIKWPTPMQPFPLLRNSLDSGEAAVIQLALDEKIGTVCIDEAAGRRLARLSGLALTGSIGILLRAKQEGHDISVRTAIQRMKEHGVWLSDLVVEFALQNSGEK